jgi:hypothetical protein
MISSPRFLQILWLLRRLVDWVFQLRRATRVGHRIATRAAPLFGEGGTIYGFSSNERGRSGRENHTVVLPRRVTMSALKLTQAWKKSRVEAVSWS